MSRVYIDTKETEDLYLIVEVYGERLNKIVRFIGKYSRPMTVLFAFLTLLLGVATVFFGVETICGFAVEWFRLPMSTITFLAAIATFSRVIRLSAQGSGRAKGTANISINQPEE